MANASKIADARTWKKWYEAGAVSQEQFPEGSLVIVSMAIHNTGKAAGYTTLSLGEAIVLSGSDYTVTDPLCKVVVPTSGKYKLGQVLDHIPANAVPVDLFFKQ